MSIAERYLTDVDAMVLAIWVSATPLEWRQNERDGVSNNRRLHRLLNC